MDGRGDSEYADEVLPRVLDALRLLMPAAGGWMDKEDYELLATVAQRLQTLPGARASSSAPSPHLASIITGAATAATASVRSRPPGSASGAVVQADRDARGGHASHPCRIRPRRRCRRSLSGFGGPAFRLRGRRRGCVRRLHC